MYDNLVKRLRYRAKREDDYYEHGGDIINEAADAIEELSRMERDFRQYISDQVKCEKGVYACCYCKNRESANEYESGCSLDECDGVSDWEWGMPKEET